MLYLIHFREPYPRDERAPIQHYLGFSKSGPYGRARVQKRLQNHAAGSGARVMRAITLAGIGWDVVRIWPDGDQTLERRLKKARNYGRALCPVCRSEPVLLRAPYWSSDYYRKLTSPREY